MAALQRIQSALQLQQRQAIFRKTQQHVWATHWLFMQGFNPQTASQASIGNRKI